MNKLEVGMYVRTKYGISKIVPDGRYIEEKENNRMIYVDKFGIPCNWEFGFYVWSNDIIGEPSNNIIDLIEVGDYVNGGQVREKAEDYIRISGGELMWQYLEIEDIKSIVTKEQFKSMEYRLGE